MTVLRCTLLFALLLVNPILATEYFVSPSGNDDAAGTKEAPWQTIGSGVKRLQAGDTLSLRAGRYHEVVSLNGLRGTSNAPIVIRSAPGETAILDGTAQITGKWSRHKGQIWKTKLKQNIWQLFVNGRNMTLARWPNSKYWTEQFWDQNKSWALSNSTREGYANGRMVDSDLTTVKVPLTGCVVVINCFNWRSRAAIITKHTPGSDRFEFTKVNSFNTRGSHHYFVTGLSLLDSEEEWFFDKRSRTLYLYSAADPNELDVRGRVFDAAFTHTSLSKKWKKKKKGPAPAQAQYVVLDGLTFHAARVNLPGVQHLTIRNCDFCYSVASRRTLQETNDADYNAFDGCNGLRLINDTFRWCDGKSLVANHADNALIENCLFHMIDFACIAGGSNSYTVQVESGRNVVYRRNEINTAGASEGMRISGPPDAAPLTELNYHTRCGLMQTDGASIQYPPGGNMNSINRFNWFINVNRTGLRFDGNPGGEWGIVYRCVSALGGHRGYRFKGDCHEVYHNLSMDNRPRSDMSISPNKGPKRYNGKANIHSRVLNNAVQTNDLQKNLIKDKANKNPNWDGINNKGDLRNELRDPDNLDFRPRKGSALIDKGRPINTVYLYREGAVTLDQGTPTKLDVSATYNGAAPDIGAYEFGDSSYWIPGRILPQASRPIPPDRAKTAKTNADLMWLQGRDAAAHRIYVGASPTTLKLQRTQQNNIFTPATAWQAGATYYWRIDTVMRSGKVVKGQVWSFSVGPGKTTSEGTR